MNDWSEQVAQGAVLITVNQRLARHYTERYQRWQLQHASRWWETPNILPLRAWLVSMHDAALASGISTRTRLPDLLQKRSWRRCIEQDSSVTLLDINGATESARQAWQLSCAWRCVNDEDQYLSLDQYTWQRWSHRYKGLLERDQQVDEPGLADHIIKLVEGRGSELVLPESVIFEGFLQFTPQQKALVEALQDAGVQVTRAVRNADAYVHHLRHADDATELLSIAGQMRYELERDPTQSLGLVVPDLQLRRSAVLRAFDRVFFPTQSPDAIRRIGRPYDLSLGLPLSEQAVVRTALSLLKLTVSDIEGSELSAVLLSPYLEAAISEARRREQLDRRLRSERVRKLDLAGLLRYLYSGSRLCRVIPRLLKSRQLSNATTSAWAGRFSQWLKLLGWPGESMDSEEFQAVAAWHECLDDMQLLDDGELLNTGRALSLMRRLARERIFQLDTPATPIQITGRLESHGLEFDCLWVAGLDSEQWPPVSTPSPFLSISEQKAQAVPEASSEARLALAEREFLLWCSQAPMLVVSHAQLRDGKSLSVAALPECRASDANVVEARERIERYATENVYIADPVNDIRLDTELESIFDGYGPPLPSGSQVRGGARLFEDQALCPFRAFALHRLRIRPLEEAGLGLDPRQHGTLLHRALELFWGNVQSHASLIVMDDESFINVIAGAVESALDELELAGALRALERIRVCTLLQEWIVQCEAPRQAFEIVSLESRQTIEHGGIIMEVMLDRIDRVGDALVVIDYKTGTSSKISTWADDRIVNPQLPLYVLTNGDIRGATFAQVARNQCVFKGIASDAALLPKVKTTVSRPRQGDSPSIVPEEWVDWRAHWQRSLDRVAAEVRQGLATVTPMKTACTHCELRSLCRIDDVSVADHEEFTEDNLNSAGRPYSNSSEVNTDSQVIGQRPGGDRA